MRSTRIKLSAVIAAGALALGVSIALALPGRVPPQDAPVPNDPPKKVVDEKAEAEKRLKPLQGKWRAVADKDAPAGDAANPFRTVNEIAHTLVTVEKDEMVREDNLSDVPLVMALKFPATGGPQDIDLVIIGGPAGLENTPLPALYKLEGDRLTLCIRDLEHLDKGRPTEFKSDETQAVNVLQRIRDEKAELKALAGRWRGERLVLAEEEVISDKNAQPNWTIDGTDVVLTGTGEQGERATIKIDPSATPPAIDLTVTRGAARGTTLVGIYCLQDDKLTVCFTSPKVKNPSRPAELQPDSDVLFYVLDRKKK
jgi:uncharacterized protein (TIGR03067 family)